MDWSLRGEKPIRQYKRAKGGGARSSGPHWGTRKTTRNSERGRIRGGTEKQTVRQKVLYEQYTRRMVGANFQRQEREKGKKGLNATGLIALLLLKKRSPHRDTRNSGR